MWDVIDIADLCSNRGICDIRTGEGLISVLAAYGVHIALIVQL